MKRIDPDDQYEYYCLDCRGIIAEGDKVCPHCGADTSEFIEQDEDSFEDDEERIHKKYPALRIIATIYQAFAVLIGIAVVISLLQPTQGPTTNPIVIIGLVVLAPIGVISFLALSESIKVFIDIEHNTRTIIQLLARRNGNDEDN